MGDLEAPCGRWGESSWLLIRRRGVEQGASLMTAEFLACETICVPFSASATIAWQQVDEIGIERVVQRCHNLAFNGVDPALMHRMLPRR